MRDRVAVVLLSGGLDSATVLAMALAEGFACHAMSFDYGQRHRHELAAAARVASSLGAARHVVVPLDLRAFGGSALTADSAVPKGRDETAMAADGIPATYVPARNLVFLSLAAGYAEVIGARDLFLGVNAVDYSGYPDCRPAFIESMERTINLATKAGVEAAERGEEWFRVVAPIIGMTKGEIIGAGLRLGVNYGLTHSCYDPVVRDGETRACGSCDSCILRRKGFKAADVKDPTLYA
ncbi:MAG TPA: 7-cyano-7-deazaguanine synthase QueC [Phycisphaerales bacterium]|nr:7-cyano-7-deazaguanine synthase QueC [Phycisphaerales bacterium]